MGSNHLDAIVGELRRMLSPSLGFSSGLRVYLPGEGESEDSKRIKTSLIDEGIAVLESRDHWLRRWDGGRARNDSDIDLYVIDGDREVFHQLDFALQEIFESPRNR
jgi:hypothetical protein